MYGYCSFAFSNQEQYPYNSIFLSFYVSTKVNMNKFETNELMSNWKNELEICSNKLKCNFFKNHSHLDSKRQKSSTRTTLYFYHFYVSTKVNMNKFETNELMSNWRMNLKYVEINWNVIFSKIILILILKGKRAVPIQLYIFKFLVSILCSSIAFTGNFNDQKSFSSWF